MPITADILAQLKKLQGQPTTSEAPSPFLKIPNSELLSKVTRGRETPIDSSPQINPSIYMRQSSDAPLSGLPENSGTGDETAALNNRPSFRLRAPDAGILGNVEGRQILDQAGIPSAAVRNGEMLPPKMHHGFWDRLKSVGEGALIGMGQQARQNAQTGREQSLESLLGAGAGGAITGGVSPLSIDALRNREQGQQDIQALGQQQGLEGQRAAIDAARMRPMLEAEKLRQEAEYRQSQQEIQRQVEEGRITRAEADRQSREKQAELNRQSREKIATLKPETPDVAAQNAPEVQGLNERVAGYQTELKQHQDEIATKNAAIRKQAEANYQQAIQDYNAQIAAGQKPAKPKRADFYEEEKNNDKDYLDGTVEKVNTRIKELQDAIKTESGNLNQLKSEGRKANEKPRAGVQSGGDTRAGTITKAQQQLWLSHNQGKTLDDMQKLYPNARMQ